MLDPFEKIQALDGKWIVRVHRIGFEFVYKTDLHPNLTAAMVEAKRWLTWAENVPKGNADTVYYILVIPETWAGPAPGAFDFAGLHMKIGRTRNVRKRFQNLKTGTSGEPIIMAMEPGSSRIEKARHKQFATDRRKGEWFVCSPKLVQYAFNTWKKNNLLPKEHQLGMLRFAERLAVYREARKLLGETPAVVNPSLNSDWAGGAVFLDLVFTDLVKKGGFYEPEEI